ncbi:MAG TPA: AsmA family protein [Stellaceae bacterium]|nr:AsmA family protein [Stellaceae bacterium]
MKKLLIGLAVLVVLVIAAAVVIPLVVPVEAYEGRLIALVKQSTGRDLKIAGPVKLSVLPALALEANDVSFANAPGARTPQMVQLKQLQVQLQLLPLLHGAVAVSRFVLVQPVIALEVDKAGHPNWVFTQAAAPSAAPARGTPQPASAGGGLAISGLTLEDVQLSDGKISYTDQRTGKAEQLDSINMKLSLPDLDSAFAGDGSAVWNGEKVSLAANIDKPRALLNGAESAVGMKLAATPITLNFSGKVTGLPPAKLGGVIDIETKSVRDLAKWVGSPITMSGSGLGPLAIKGTVAMAGTKTSFSDADLSLDAIKTKGSVSIDSAGARPAINGKLDVDKLDLNPYLPPESPQGARPAAAGGSAPASSAAAQSGWSDAPIDVSPLNLADVDLDLKVGGIVYRKYQIGASALGVHLKDGQLTGDLSQMALYQGTGHGKVTVDGSGAVPSVGINFNLAQVQIEPLAQAAMDSDRLTGTGTFDIAATGHGKSQRDIISTLNGKGAMNLANGQVKGVNLLALAENAAKSLVGGDSGGNATNFGTLTGTYTITNGLLRNSDLQLKSGAVPMTGAGTVDLPTRVVDYKVSPQLAGGITVPIQISGTWDNLSYRPDLAGILQGAVQSPGKVLDTLKSGGGSVGQGLGGVGQGVGGALKGILGK